MNSPNGIFYSPNDRSILPVELDLAFIDLVVHRFTGSPAMQNDERVVVLGKRVYFCSHLKII
jgi:hypothetical protein